MTDHKRQHWIPDTYLSAWCDPDPATQNPRRVYRYGRDGAYRDYRPPSRLFTVDDLYTVPAADGGRDLSTEHAFTALEDSFARIRDRLLVPCLPIPADARRDLTWFIAALRNRSPAMRDHKRSIDDRILEIANDLQARLSVMTPEARREFARRTRSSSSADDKDTSIPLPAFRELAARPFGIAMPRDVVQEAGLLERMHLSVLRCPAGGERLITSDNPVSWWDPAEPRSRHPPGLGRWTVEITVPLTPTMAAVISHAPGSDYVDIDGATVEELNMRTLAKCRETFISSSREPDRRVAPV